MNMFNHRFNQENAASLLEVVNVINASVRKAESILLLTQANLSEEAGQFERSIILNAIDAAMDELNDIDAVIDAHFEAVKTKLPTTDTPPEKIQCAAVVANIRNIASMIERNGLMPERD